MKFLCVPCDTPMTLVQTAPPDDGSVALTYSCPDCGYEMAMLTNRFETEVVGSLGVKLGSGTGAAGDAAQAGAADAGESKCPFSGMVRGMQEAAGPEAGGFPWTAEAATRLSTIPEFVRPMAKTGIEKYAREKGYSEVNDTVLDEARHFFGM